MPVILAIQEAGDHGSKPPRQIANKTLSQKNPSYKKGWWGDSN
jgi:hypothetical protein